MKDREESDLHKHLGTAITLRGGAVHGHGLPVTGELQSEVLPHELLDHLLEDTEKRGFIVESQFHILELFKIKRALTEQQALALSILDRFFTLVLNTFIFSTRQHRAVSVASPTFS